MDNLHPKRMKSTSFAQKIEGSSAAFPLFPLVHTCDAHSFREIIASGEITPARCDTFKGEDLSYFYYGKPSYRTSKTNDAISLNSAFPICFVVNTAKASPKRVFPLDSGAFCADLFREYFHRNTNISDLELNPNIESAAKIVSKFYGSNVDYFNGVANDVEYDVMDFEIQSIIELISARQATAFDDRRAVVELQFDSDVKLNKDSVKLVLLPTTFLDSDLVQKKILDDWKAEVRTYSVAHFNPKEYVSMFYRELESFYEDIGIF